ncbi:MAG TPA: hypothetical protein V6D18_14560 [Thermosynechococcaceae cyanobacterium]
MSDIPLPSKISAGLTLSVTEVLQHWYDHRPTMYAELYHAGNLVERATEAYEATFNAAYDLEMELRKQGCNPGMAEARAWETVREWYMFLPTEEDEPELQQQEDGLYFYRSEPPEDTQP